ncbi:MAG: amidohydrolase [Deltaproteobacteria bacterium]|nr:MAG: amidohydrolase [Deltaproteobacteria bacterium]
MLRGAGELMSRNLTMACSAILLACGCRSAHPNAPAPGTSQGGTTFVRGTLVRSDGSVVEDAVVAIEGTRIARVATAREMPIPQGAAVIGGSGKWIIPGLIDAHVHFFQSGGLYTRPDVIDLTTRVSYAEETRQVRAALPETFRRYLRAGVTSVIDFGGPEWNFDMRELATRTPLAPRVAVAGPLLSSLARPQLDLGDPPIRQVTEPGAARAMVRAEAPRKPDFIKLWWPLGPGHTPQTWQPVAAAALDEAHALGLRVAVHATELEVARLALKMGADVLVHSVVDAEVDDDFIRLLREGNVGYVTTLAVFGGYPRVLSHKVQLIGAEMELADPKVVATVLEPFAVPENRYRGPPGPAARRNVRRVWDGGGLLAAGSDAGNIGTFHAAGLHRELEELVGAGLTPAEALTAATANAARVMGRTDLGGIEPGEILPRTAEDIVQAQVNAFNAQDLEAFLSTYADDAVVVRAGTGETLMSGKQSMRERYGSMFARFPANRVRIAERKIEGTNTVIDHEIVTGRGPERPDPWDLGWVRYELGDGLIRKVALP